MHIDVFVIYKFIHIGRFLGMKFKLKSFVKYKSSI